MQSLIINYINNIMQTKKYPKELKEPSKNILYTLEEVLKHNEIHDLWIVIYNEVYDVTKFVQEGLHPGGPEVILECGGGDATEPFDDVAHSTSASIMFHPYRIGGVIPSEHKQYDSVRQKLLEAEAKIQRLKLEKLQLVEEKKRQRKVQKLWENLTLFLLTIVALSTIIFYFALQVYKGTYSEGSKKTGNDIRLG